MSDNESSAEEDVEGDEDEEEEEEEDTEEVPPLMVPAAATIKAEAQPATAPAVAPPKPAIDASDALVADLGALSVEGAMTVPIQDAAAAILAADKSLMVRGSMVGEGKREEIQTITEQRWEQIQLVRKKEREKTRMVTCRGGVTFRKEWASCCCH